MTSAFDALAKSFEKAFAQQEDDAMKGHLNLGYKPLNKIISGRYDGGLPNGKMIEIFGDPSCGKTALATLLMAEAQKQGGCAIFEDNERSFNTSFAERLGLDTSPGRFLYRKPKTWEEANMEMAKFAQMIRSSGAVPDNAPIVAVLDSVAAAVPQSMTDKEIDAFTMNDNTALARVASTTLKVIKQHMDKFKFTTIYLNQTRTKPGIAYGDPTVTPGGSAFEFYADARLHLRRKLVKDADKNFLGQVINCYAKKTKFTRPFQDCDIRLMFEEDGFGYFDVVTSTVEFLIANGKLPKSGNFVTWIDGKNYYPKALAEKIKAEGSLAALEAMLDPAPAAAAA